jgi:Tol biopolymer transport system component
MRLRLQATLLAAACSRAPAQTSETDRGADVGRASVPSPSPASAPREVSAVPERPPPPAPFPVRVLLHEDGIENAYPRVSADGTQILYQSNRTGKWQLFVMDLESGEQRRVLDDAWNDNFVDWSADGEWVAFVSDRDGNEEIYRVRIDGTKLERLTDHPARDIHPYFSPDGKSLLFNSTREKGDFDIYRLDLAKKRVTRLTDTEHNDTCARDSPDMKQIVLLRNDVTMDDVVLLDPATGAATNLTKTPRVMDGWPMFSADGAWIYYSTTATGAHAIHRVHPDGTGDETLTIARTGEEHGRAFIGRDGRTLVFNERRPGGIDISMLELPPG